MWLLWWRLVLLVMLGVLVVCCVLLVFEIVLFLLMCVQVEVCMVVLFMWVVQLQKVGWIVEVMFDLLVFQKLVVLILNIGLWLQDIDG